MGGWYNYIIDIATYGISRMAYSTSMTDHTLWTRKTLREGGREEGRVGGWVGESKRRRESGWKRKGYRWKEEK